MFVSVLSNLQQCPWLACEWVNNLQLINCEVSLCIYRPESFICEFLFVSVEILKCKIYIYQITAFFLVSFFKVLNFFHQGKKVLNSAVKIFQQITVISFIFTFPIQIAISQSEWRTMVCSWMVKIPRGHITVMQELYALYRLGKFMESHSKSLRVDLHLFICSINTWCTF